MKQNDIKQTSTCITSSSGLRGLGFILCLGILPAIAGLTSCSTERDAKEDARECSERHASNGDCNVTLRVKEALAANAHHSQFKQVRVETDDGIVELEGSVSSK